MTFKTMLAQATGSPSPPKFTTMKGTGVRACDSPVSVAPRSKDALIRQAAGLPGEA